MLHNDTRTQQEPCVPDATALAMDFRRWTALWHAESASADLPDNLPEALHRANFTLWHLEDMARDPRANDSTIAETKRAIDRTNQQRNDLVERFDVALLDELARHALPDPAAPLHSETPGMIADRLSILALKLFHTAEEAERADADDAHRERNGQRLRVLQRQQEDLVQCLAELLQAVLQSSRSYRLYRQMKMYNDPQLNPVLYRASRNA